jgi:hypothetical protein
LWTYNNAWTTNTAPGAPVGAANTVGPGFLVNKDGEIARMLGGPCDPSPCGGIDADVATVAGDYCNEYRLPVFNTNTSWPFSKYTGFPPDAPLEGYQRTNGTSMQASTCQAQAAGGKYGWGQWIQPADPGSNCGGPEPEASTSSCGIHHYLSLVGTSDYPWSKAFGRGPKLTFMNTMKVGAYHDRWHRGSAAFFAWHHLCAVLGFNRSDGKPSVLELCAVEWRSPSSRSWTPFTTSSGSAPRGNHVNCARHDRAEAIGYLNPVNPAGRFLTTITGSGQSGTITSGATGQWTFQVTVTKRNLRNVIKAMPAQCQVSSSWSKDPKDYQLLGFEDGIEAGGAAKYLDYFGSSVSLLKSWTAY